MLNNEKFGLVFNAILLLILGFYGLTIGILTFLKRKDVGLINRLSRKYMALGSSKYTTRVEKHYRLLALVYILIGLSSIGFVIMVLVYYIM